MKIGLRTYGIGTVGVCVFLGVFGLGAAPAADPLPPDGSVATKALEEPFGEAQIAATGEETYTPDEGVRGDSIVCPPDGRVAFSVIGRGPASQGPALTLAYNTAIVTNVGGGWSTAPGGSTFTAPCDGIYVFAVSFVRDPYYYSGTNDDVWVSVMKNGHSMGRAWAGETDGRQRSTGAYTVSLVLAQGDEITTLLDNDGSEPRHPAEFNFTGFRLY